MNVIFIDDVKKQAFFCQHEQTPNIFQMGDTISTGWGPRWPSLRSHKSTTHFERLLIYDRMLVLIVYKNTNVFSTNVTENVMISVTGDGATRGLMQGFVKEPWFIATLIGTIGGTLWFALCVFSIWLYRKKKARKKLHKNGVMTGIILTFCLVCYFIHIKH